MDHYLKNGVKNPILETLNLLQLKFNMSFPRNSIVTYPVNWTEYATWDVMQYERQCKLFQFMIHVQM